MSHSHILQCPKSTEKLPYLIKHIYCRVLLLPSQSFCHNIFPQLTDTPSAITILLGLTIFEIISLSLSFPPSSPFPFLPPPLALFLVPSLLSPTPSGLELKSKLDQASIQAGTHPPFTGSTGSLHSPARLTHYSPDLSQYRFSTFAPSCSLSSSTPHSHQLSLGLSSRVGLKPHLPGGYVMGGGVCPHPATITLSPYPATIFFDYKILEHTVYLHSYMLST